MNTPKTVSELLPLVFAKKCAELPFKYKDQRVFEPLYDRILIANFPRYILLDGQGNADLADDDECIEIVKLSEKPRNKIASLGYDTSEMSDEWAEGLASDIDKH